MSDTTDHELRKIYRRCDISNNRTDDPLGEEAFIEAITQLFTKQLEEAYKKGYIDGGIATLTQDTKGETK